MFYTAVTSDSVLWYRWVGCWYVACCLRILLYYSERK